MGGGYLEVEDEGYLPPHRNDRHLDRQIFECLSLLIVLI